MVADAPTTSTTITMTADTELVIADNASANSVVLPNDTDVPNMPRFKPIVIWQRGNGLTTLVGGTGVTLRVHNDLTAVSAGRDSIMTAMKVGDNTYLISGHLEPDA
jgi:hypothetical protein